MVGVSVVTGRMVVVVVVRVVLVVVVVKVVLVMVGVLFFSLLLPPHLLSFLLPLLPPLPLCLHCLLLFITSFRLSLFLFLFLFCLSVSFIPGLCFLLLRLLLHGLSRPLFEDGDEGVVGVGTEGTGLGDGRGVGMIVGEGSVVLGVVEVLVTVVKGLNGEVIIICMPSSSASFSFSTSSVFVSSSSPSFLLSSSVVVVCSVVVPSFCVLFLPGDSLMHLPK